MEPRRQQLAHVGGRRRHVDREQAGAAGDERVAVAAQAVERDGQRQRDEAAVAAHLVRHGLPVGGAPVAQLQLDGHDLFAADAEDVGDAAVEGHLEERLEALRLEVVRDGRCELALQPRDDHVQEQAGRAFNPSRAAARTYSSANEKRPARVRVCMTLARIELNLPETRTLLALARTRHADLARMVQGLEEGEGMDLQRHNALKTLNKQQDELETILLKLEGALHELRSKPA